jgi:inorganic pyrophosphatase
MAKKKAASRKQSTPFNEDGKTLNVVIETPRGSRNKFKYDEELKAFKLKSVLPAGASFPYDFGFVPGTKGEDGDPLDVLVLMDEPAFAGCHISCKLIGVIEATQTEDGDTYRNDRLVAVANDAHNYRELRSINDLSKNLLDELVHFFKSYNEMKGKEFELVALHAAQAAHSLVDQATNRRGAKR